MITQTLYLAGSLVAGLGAGSVVNVLSDRVYDDEAQYQTQQCQACGAVLPAKRLVPLAGFGQSYRRCRACGKFASPRAAICSAVLGIVYPLLLAHIIASGGALGLPIPVVFLIEALALALLAFIFVVDLEHKLILDVAVYPALAALLLIAALFDHHAFAAMLTGLAVYGGLFVFLYGLGFVIYRTEALGLGDVKLAMLIGLMVGWPTIAQALVLSALFGAAVSLLLLGLGVAGRRTYIPYGIFMATGALLALLLATPYW